MQPSVPERMTCVEISRAGRTGGAEARRRGRRPARPGRGADQGRRGRHQRPRRLPAARALSAAARRDRHSRPGGLGHHRRTGRGRCRLARRRHLLRADHRRRLRRILHRARRAVPAGPGRARSGRCRRRCRRPSSPSGRNVFERAALAPGETLLVHGGGGGIGTTAIQIAAAFGHRVFTTAAAPSSARPWSGWARRAPSTSPREDFAAVIKEATGGKGVNVILDIVGGDYVARNIASLARDGRLVQHRLPQGQQGRDRPDAGDAEAADAHRLDTARAVGRAQGRDRRGSARSGSGR